MNPLVSLATAIQKAGFDSFAIMSAIPLKNMLPILSEMQAEDRYPAFVDRDIAKRSDPKNLQPSAKSIISLAISYNTGHPGISPSLHGTISRSAWGQDYHHVLAERMDRVIAYLKQYFGAKECTKAVDTSFLIERAIAVQGGLGYPGSNCSVYVPPFGSWIFLGEILVDVDLPLTESKKQDNWSCPIECDLCLKACPTKALFAPGKINPQRCISYLTQMSGPIPLEFRERIGNRLWGCDTCQEACPRNQKTPLTSHQEFAPLYGSHIPLLPLLELSKKEFATMFGPTSMAWRGKNTIQRNACIVLGNQGSPEPIPALEKTAQGHPSSLVREAAAWAVEHIKTKLKR